jgi:hypothetical protein
VRTATKIAAGSLSAVALVSLVGVGISYADDPTGSPSASPNPTASGTDQPKTERRADHKGKRGLLKRGLHGEVTVGGQQTRVIVFQRGTVDEVSASEVKVTSTDGFSKTYTVTARTRVRQAGEAGRLDDIERGDKVRVVAVRTGDTSTATAIREPRP